MMGRVSAAIVAIGAAIGIAVGCGAAQAQDFLSPQPLVRQKSPAKPAPARQNQRAQQANATAPAAPKPVIAENVGDWRLQCFAKPARACQISQRRINPANNSMLIWVELTRSLKPKPNDRFAVMLPLGFKIEPTLTVEAEGKTFVETPIVTCIPAGCLHQLDLTPARVEQLQDTKRLTAQMVDMRGQRIALPVTMRGFKQAFLKSAVFLRGK